MCTQPAKKFDADIFEPHRLTVKRFILAFHAVLYKDLRDVDSLADLKEMEYLSSKEVDMLMVASGPRSHIIIGWYASRHGMERRCDWFLHSCYCCFCSSRMPPIRMSCVCVCVCSPKH